MKGDDVASEIIAMLDKESERAENRKYDADQYWLGAYEAFSHAVITALEIVSAREQSALIENK